MKKSIKLNNLILVLLVFTSLLQSCKKSVDYIAYNGNIYTVNNDFNVASAFAVKDGKFIDVGNDEIFSKYNTKQKIDLNGSTVLPGLIDAHCHFYGLGLNQSVIDLTGTSSFNEILEKIAFENNKDVIRGRGWDQNDWEIKEFPDKLKLDLAYPNTPVILERIDGHAYLVNQKALDIAGIDINTTSTNGTVLSKKGKLTGVLIDGPMSIIDDAFGEISLDNKIKALISAQKICFQNGLTTVDDAGLSKKVILLIDSLQKKDLLKMRVYAMISNSEDDVDYFLENGPIKTNSLNVRSVKVYGDGALGSRGATLKEPYSDDKHNYGKLVTSYKDIKDLADKLAKANFQMNTHAIGDSTINILIDTYSKVLENKTDPRWRIEHSQIIDLNDIDGYNNKILPSVQPTHATSDMYWANDRVGSKRIKGAYAYKALLEKSKVIGLGTDFPVEKVNPFHTFYASISRKDLNDYPEKGFEFENALSREETLKGMTIWAAYANFEEEIKGSIEVGKMADMVILKKDIMEIDINTVTNVNVIATIVDGVMVYRASK